MLSAKRFKLKEQALAVEVLFGKRSSVSIPVGSIITVISESAESDQSIEVLWGARKLEIFACDLHMRGIEIMGPKSEDLAGGAPLSMGARAGSPHKREG